MRLPRSPLLRRLTDPDLPSVVLLEAPPGYGKSWLVRRAAGQDVLRLRGELGPLATSAEPPPSVVIDDGHQLSPADVELLVERIEDAPGEWRLMIAGRILADTVHEAAHLVDGLIIDATALAVAPRRWPTSCPPIR